MTNRLAWAVLWLAACGSSGGGSGQSTLDDDGTGKQGDAGRGKDARVDARTPPSSVDCASKDDDDSDEDGFTPADGDCNDCNAKVNPGAYDYTTDNVDDDCSGSAAKESDAPCDEQLAIDSTDAQDAARAIGLCNFSSASAKSWGVVSARFTDASGAGAIGDRSSAGLLRDFGAAKPIQGDALLALSSGVARAPGQPGFTEDCDSFDVLCIPSLACTNGGNPPAGYPKETSTCRGEGTGNVFQPGTQIYNQAALELQIRVPNNAGSLSFDSIFYTTEYPNFICDSFNDFFVVFKEPKPDGVTDGNIVFDSNNDPVGVNTGLLAVCDPSIQDPSAEKQFDCRGGTDLLTGTGYGAGENSCEVKKQSGASTGWLHTTAPVTAGELITLRFAIWDTNDANLDSTVLIDNFKWSKDGADVGTIPIVF
jgi:hypothetical protein